MLQADAKGKQVHIIDSSSDDGKPVPKKSKPSSLFYAASLSLSDYMYS